jgi:phage gp36-like protein
MYSTLNGISNKIDKRILIQLLNDEVRPDSNIDLTEETDLIIVRFNQAASDAQEEIDPYLRGRYKFPFDSVPKIVVNLSDDITIYNIYKRRNRDNMPDSILSIKKEVTKQLEQIQKGMLDIGIASEPQKISNEIRTNKTSGDKLFSKHLWDKY